MTLTAKRLHKILHYDPATGEFTWKTCLRHGWSGRRAGWPNSRGYIIIRIVGRPYLAHRLAWLYMTGAWPRCGLDHSNLDTGDNRYANLRLATGTQNKANTGRQKNNRSGFKGVTWFARTGRWKASIKRERRTTHLGYFDSAEDAHAAYCSAALRLYGEFARTA